MKRVVFALLVVLAVSLPAMASDAYVVRFHAPGPMGVTAQALWRDDVLFFNTGSAAASVRLLGVSNGDFESAAVPQLLIPPGQLVSLNAKVSTAWDPIGTPAMWVLHLDVPAGVVVESRDEYYVAYVNLLVSPIPTIPVGKVSMPIFRSLIAAGAKQVEVGTDLSGNSSHENVGVYNAGNEEANAVIELHSGCDGSIVDGRTVTIPANSIVQINGLSAGATVCSGYGTTNWARYTTVTVSQPSFTFVSSLNDNITLPAGSPQLPIVGLAVTKSEAF